MRNPWRFDERARMIGASLPEHAARLRIRPLHDHPYADQAWLAEVQRTVLAEVDADGIAAARICLVSHLAQHGAGYLQRFPQWDLVDTPRIDGLSASEMREDFIRAALDGDTAGLARLGTRLPAPVFSLLQDFRSTPACVALLQEYACIRDYRRQFAGVRHPLQFITTSAVVVDAGHILLVRRGAQPGKGLPALPGGFVGSEERILDACLRVLLEETRLKLPEKVLRGMVRASHVFDAPERSLRGRTVSHAWHFDFPSGELPAVKGSGDTAPAYGYPLARFENMEERLFEDHFHIANDFLRQV